MNTASQLWLRSTMANHVTLSLTKTSLFSSLVVSQPLTAQALQHFINSDNPSQGQAIHANLLKSGFKPDANISIKLLILHLKCGSIAYARKMFDELPRRSLSAYNYMIAGYIKHGLVNKSLSFIRKLIDSGENPDAYTLSMMLKASTRDDCHVPFLGRIVHAQIIKLDVEPDDVLYTALIDSYVKCGTVNYARTVFDTMLERDIVCSTSMITGYMNRGDFTNAEEIFQRTTQKDVVVFNAMIEGYSKLTENASQSLEIYIEMQRWNFRPNISTFASVIGACSVLAGYAVGQQVQSQLTKTEFFSTVKIGSALIDMYSKCGRVEDARRVFDHMPERNVFSWTSMIDGYGKSGFPQKALELFSLMQKCRVEPNYVTFLGALSACAHAGLVDEGLRIFEIMKKEYSLRPKMEHYACVVDLLGRAGDLGRAWELVKAMPEKPSSDVWSALLSCCRLHGCVELANLAAEEIFKLNPNERPGAYVALSNALAEAGKWESVSEVRERMKERGVLKGTASSWI